MMRSVLALAVGMLLVSCGPASDLWVRVEAPLLVPSQCDALQISVTRSSDGGSLYTHVFTLDEKQQFPMTLSLSTRSSQDLGTPVRVSATARLGGQDVAPAASTEVTLADGQVAPATVQIVLP